MERRPGDLSGPKSLEAWIEVYERRCGHGCKFSPQPDELVYFHPEHGFFTYLIDYCQRALVMPVMCGDGAFLRAVCWEMARG